MTRRTLALLVAVPTLVLGLAAACGGDDDESAATTPAATGESGGGGGGGTSLQLTADPNGALAFDKTELTASAGEVTIELINMSSMPHNVEVEGNGVEEVSDTISESTTELTLNLEPGEYDFYCAIPGHREAGMEGTLVVE